RRLARSSVHGPALSQVPAGPAATASIVEALKAAAGHSKKGRAILAKGRCVRGTYVPSGLAKDVTRSRSFTKPSRVLARFSTAGDPDVTGIPALRNFCFRLGDDGHRTD